MTWFTTQMKTYETAICTSANILFIGMWYIRDMCVY